MSLLCLTGLLAATGRAAVAQGHDPANQTEASKHSSPLTNRAGTVVELKGAGTVISFETFPNGSPVPAGTEITDQYVSLGVTFDSSCPDGASLTTNVFDFVATSSPPNQLVPCGPAPFNGDTLVLTFDPLVTFVSAFIIDDQLPVDITAFDEFDNQVDALQSDGTNSGFELATVSHGDGIERVEMAGRSFFPNSPDGWGIDDLTFGRILVLVDGFESGDTSAWTTTIP